MPFRGGFTRDRFKVKFVRYILIAVASGTVILTVVAGLLFGTLWAVIIATVGILIVIMTVGYIQIKTLQTVTQRLAGIQKQNERSAASLAAVQAVTNKYPAGGTIKLPKEVQRAFEDLTLASRSLTVPQMHFDQLLRTISANTIRTESALNDTVDELRDIVVRNGGTALEEDAGTQAR